MSGLKPTKAKSKSGKPKELIGLKPEKGRVVPVRKSEALTGPGKKLIAFRADKFVRSLIYYGQVEMSKTGLDATQTAALQSAIVMAYGHLISRNKWPKAFRHVRSAMACKS